MSYESLVTLEEEERIRLQKRRASLLTLGFIAVGLTVVAAYQKPESLSKHIRALSPKPKSGSNSVHVQRKFVGADSCGVIVCSGECDEPGCSPGSFVCALPDACLPRVQSNGQSCAAVCRNHGSEWTEIKTGTYQHGGDFDFCQAEPGDEGFRGGYNLGGGHCVVGYGGTERTTSSFECRCKMKDTSLMLVPANNQNCQNVCPLGSPLETGTYTHTQQTFYACAANYNNEGFRGGYQLGTNCVVGHGGGEKGMGSFLCICRTYISTTSR